MQATQNPPERTEAEQRGIELLREAVSGIDDELLNNPKFNKIVSLLIRPPRPVVAINNMEHYARAKQQRQKKIQDRSRQLLQWQMTNTNRDLYEYRKFYKKQKKINGLKSIY